MFVSKYSQAIEPSNKLWLHFIWILSWIVLTFEFIKTKLMFVVDFNGGLVNTTRRTYSFFEHRPSTQKKCQSKRKQVILLTIQTEWSLERGTSLESKKPPLVLFFFIKERGKVENRLLFFLVVVWCGQSKMCVFFCKSIVFFL